MEWLFDLWLPILLSAVFVFAASFIIWMFLPYHKADIKVLPDERKLTDHLKTLNLSPGLYMFPNCQSAAEMRAAEFRNRMNEGPWGTVNLRPGKPNMGLNLAVTFIFYVIVSIFVAYITKEARAYGADYLTVFQVAGASAILGYCAGGIPNAIFIGKPLRFVITDLIDGVIYGLLTAGTFAWLWPDAPVQLPGVGG